jgi:chromosome segregation ATPase
MSGNNRFQVQITLLNEEIRVYKQASDDKDLKVNLFKARIDTLQIELNESRQKHQLPKVETREIIMDCNCKIQINELQNTIQQITQLTQKITQEKELHLQQLHDLKNVVEKLNSKISTLTNQEENYKQEIQKLKRENYKLVQDIQAHTNELVDNKHQFINNLHCIKQENKSLHIQKSELQENINELENLLMIANDNIQDLQKVRQESVKRRR